jgi:hypothetical protein
MTPGNEDLVSQSEKFDVMRSDQTVREQRQWQQQREASTYLDQYHSDIGGRFSVTQHETVTGRVSAAPPPLPSTSPWSGSQPEPGIEPPLGYRVDEMIPIENPAGATSSSPVATGGAPSAPPDVAAPPPSSGANNK